MRRPRGPTSDRPRHVANQTVLIGPSHDLQSIVPFFAPDPRLGPTPQGPMRWKIGTDNTVEKTLICAVGLGNTPGSGGVGVGISCTRL